MSIINEDEILARVHKYKLFRREGNLFIDVYEGILGRPEHKFVAHIKSHLKPNQEVVCKICGKPVRVIWDELAALEGRET